MTTAKDITKRTATVKRKIFNEDLFKMLEMTESVNDDFEKRMETYNLYEEELYGKPLVAKLQKHVNSIKNYLWMDRELLKPLVDAIENEDYEFLKTTNRYSPNYFAHNMFKLIRSKILYQNSASNNYINEYNGSTFGIMEYLNAPTNIYHLAFPKVFKYILKSSFWSFDQDPIGIYFNSTRQMTKWDNGKFCIIGFTWGFMLQSLATKTAYYYEGLRNGKFCRYKDLLIMKYDEGTVVVDWPLVKFIRFDKIENYTRYDVVDVSNLSEKRNKIDLTFKCYDIQTDQFVQKKVDKISENYNLTCEGDYLFLDGEPIIHIGVGSISHNDNENAYVYDRHNQLVNVQYQNVIY